MDRLLYHFVILVIVLYYCLLIFPILYAAATLGLAAAAILIAIYLIYLAGVHWQFWIFWVPIALIVWWGSTRKVPMTLPYKSSSPQRTP
jgi:hypothetical protein